MFYLEAGDTAQGIAFFEKSKAVTPRDADLAYYHGIALGLTGRIDEAAKRLNDGITIAPDDGQTYFALYSLLADHGRMAEAGDVLRRWLARHPDDAQARMMLERIGGAGPTGSLAPLGGPGTGVGGAGIP
jgi:Flp pilus assembly protein TadD